MAYTPPTYPHLPDVTWGVDVPARVDIVDTSSSGTSSQSQSSQAQVAAENAPLRIIYGEARIGAQIADAIVYQGKLVVVAVWGEGPIEAVSQVWMDDAALPSGVTATHYTGAPGQVVNATLVAAYATIGVSYSDPLDGVAYSVFVVSTGTSSGFPSFTATIKGRKVYDPRGTPTTAWSENPSLCLADFLQSTTYGRGRIVDYSTVGAAADANDTLLAGEKKRLIGLVIDSVAETRQWVETLRAYAGCWVTEGENGLKLLPDVAESSSFSFTKNNILERSLSLAKLGVRETPTVVEVVYTDTSTIPWAEKSAFARAAGVETGATPRRESRVSLLGIKRYSQAYREAVERLNHFTLEDLYVEFVAFDEALALEVGAVVDVTHPIGLTAKKLKITAIGSVAPGRWGIKTKEHDPAVYSNVVVSEPTYSDTTLPNPTSPPTPTGLVAVEEVFQLENGTYSSRLKVSWTASDYPYLLNSRVEVYESGQLIYTATTREPVYRTGAVQEGKDYVVKVAFVSTVGATGSWAQTNVTAAGKYLVPSDVPSISAFEVGGTVRASWTPSVDIDIWRYELRYGALAGSWDDAVLLDRVDSLRLTTSEIPVGTWRLYVKALDSVGQYSANAATVTFSVTSDSNSFLVDTREHVSARWYNQMSYSEDLSAANWDNTYRNGTISTNVAVAPDGTTTADRYTENTAASVARYITQTTKSYVAGKKYTAYAWAHKDSGSRYLGLVFGAAAFGANAIASFTLEGDGSGYINSYATNTSAAIRYCGDGWYLCSLTSEATATTTANGPQVRLSNSPTNGAPNYTGDGTSGLLIWGVHVTESPYPHEHSQAQVGRLWDAGTGVGMWGFSAYPDYSVRYYVTEDNVAFGNKFSSTLDTYTDPLATYHESMDSRWCGFSLDFGQELSGQWLADCDVTAINGSVESFIGLSNDNVWTEDSYLSGLSQKATGRYVRLRHDAAGSSTMLVAMPTQSVRLDAVPREEVGTGTSSATEPTLILLENTYTAVKKIVVTPSGDTARSGIVDAIAVGTAPGTLLNAGFEETTLTDWSVLDWSGTPGTIALETTTFHEGAQSMKFSDASLVYAAGSKAVSVSDRALYKIRAWVYVNSAAASGFFLRVNEKSSYPSGDYVTVALRDGYQDLVSDGGLEAGWNLIDVVYDPTAGTKYGSIVFYHWTGLVGKVMVVDDVQILTNAFNVYVFDSDGVQIVSDFFYSFQGV